MTALTKATPIRLLLLAASWAVTACGLLAADTIPVKTGPEGAVWLERVPSRGTTVRYSSPLRSFRAGHPVSLSSQVMEQALRGIHVGIAPTERDNVSPGIKPVPLFSATESAFLAPGITAALERAEPDQRVRFQVGPESDRTAGTLYVEDGIIRLALSQVHATTQSKDGPLSIYILSFKPEQAQERSSSRHDWLEIEPDQPRVAIDYAALKALGPPEVPTARSTAASIPSGSDERTMKDVVDRQAKELEALRAELEALKKQIQGQHSKP